MFPNPGQKERADYSNSGEPVIADSAVKRWRADLSSSVGGCACGGGAHSTSRLEGTA